MADIVPYGDSYGAVSRRTEKAISRIEQSNAVTRARIDSHEALAAYQIARRVENGYRLASHTVREAVQLNRQVSSVASNNPGLDSKNLSPTKSQRWRVFTSLAANGGRHLNGSSIAKLSQAIYAGRD